MTLNIANHNALQLPLDFVTERIAFLARTGAGKSGGMHVLAEEMIRAGQFIVFLDPKGDAWGIRAAGEGDGLPVLLLGGERCDRFASVSTWPAMVRRSFRTLMNSRPSR